MLPRLALALGAAGMAAAALAQQPSPPATPDACYKIAFELHQRVEEKKLPDEEFDKFDALLTTLESQCDSAAFGAAMTSAADIEARLGKIQ